MRASALRAKTDLLCRSGFQETEKTVILTCGTMKSALVA